MRLFWRAAMFAASCTLPVSSTLPIFGQMSAAVATGKDVAIGSPIALTFYVAPAHLAAAEAKARSIQTPGSKDYHQFLTVKEFVADYAVSDADLQSIEGSLRNLGFNIAYVFPNHLAIEVTGTVSTAQTALGVTLKEFVLDGKTGFAPSRPITLPPELQGKVTSVGGLNTLRHPHPMHRKSAVPEHTAKRIAPGTLVGGEPGDYLPADFAKFYNVDPLYNRGFSGRGSTIGIVTLANFNPADAYSFWKAIGLSVSQTRITRVDVDGGTAGPINPDGEGETDLDVEYSGALAPKAKVRVYVAPLLTDSNFIDGFEAAASENLADTVSTSWGEPELFYFPDLAPAYPSETYILDDFHAVFLEMALQGQTLYVASGDSGAFDTVRACSPFGTPSATNLVCNAPYAVDAPSSDPLVTAAGGTTLPYSFTTRSGFHIFNKKERAWAWDYIATEAAEQGFGSVYTLDDFFSVGGGGGVSAYHKLPWYQNSTPGITRTVGGQYFTLDFGAGAVIDVILPDAFAGRNTPDLSANADPESGYQYIQEGMVIDGYGGTSFVAPQLNGVTALFVEATGKRVGQINPALYRLGQSASSDIRLGDNWGYAALPGFDNASGLGTLNAELLLKGLETLEQVK